MNRKLFFGFCVLPLLCGCGDSSDTANPPISITKRFANLEITLSAPKTRYALGEAIPFTYTQKNIGNASTDLNFTIGCIVDREFLFNNVVVAPSYNCGGGSSRRLLNPGEVSTADYTWNQKNNNDIQVDTGRYTIRFKTNLASIDSVPVTDQQRASDLVTETEIVIE